MSRKSRGLTTRECLLYTEGFPRQEKPANGGLGQYRHFAAR
ncbi:hypothetical protein THTE_2451 [Thermogutta terrifontis]|uniref:Uncharacterized protein n=1 Tax=Thermogutta terrifontis TaxID=1331910 RepID=A0A286RGG4_9BACT|nr:hypothetical protein THTE_2451 [Thermogutta terrifontis]